MRSGAIDDTFDDLAVSDPSELGADAPTRRTRLQSYVPRDPKVRAEVRRRAGGRCERPSCGESRPYRGFLDVHHVLGAAKSDRVNNCVAVCPNCHREAHYSPEADAINAELLMIAKAP
jgi:5-methylcytosine-specific restriction protein A